MGRKFNFGAGPATLPTSVLEEVKNELLDFEKKHKYLNLCGQYDSAIQRIL